MPADLTDYLRQGTDGRVAVDLTDGLSPSQVAELLSQPAAAASASRDAIRSLPAKERTQMSAVALLHAYEATHGHKCALAQLRRGGPIGNDERDRVMIRLYCRLTGDHATSSQRLVEWSRVLYRRRVQAQVSGTLAKDNPSLGMRRFFGRLTLKERVALGHTGGAERMDVELRVAEPPPGFQNASKPVFVHKKTDAMNIRGLHVGDVYLLQGDAVLGCTRTIGTSWFQARITGFVCRVGLPPIMCDFLCTESGSTNPAKMPPTLCAFVRRKQFKCMQCKQMLKGLKAHVCGEPDADEDQKAVGMFASKDVAQGAMEVSKDMDEWAVQLV